MEAFKEWCVEFIQRPNCSDYLAEIDKLDLHPEAGHLTPPFRLRDWVLRECYQASTFENTSQQRRKLNKEARSKAPAQVASLKKLRNYIHRYPETANQTVGQAILRWKSKHDAKSEFYVAGATIPIHELFDDLLWCYQQVLDKDISPLHLSYETEVGPLLYNQPPERKQETETNILLNGLLFRLVFLFRLATAGHDLILQEGMKMPADGEPHYDLAANIVSLVDPDHPITEPDKKLKNLIGRGARLGSW